MKKLNDQSGGNKFNDIFSTNSTSSVRNNFEGISSNSSVSTASHNLTEILRTTENSNESTLSSNQTMALPENVYSSSSSYESNVISSIDFSSINHDSDRIQTPEIPNPPDFNDMGLNDDLHNLHNLKDKITTEQQMEKDFAENVNAFSEDSDMDTQVRISSSSKPISVSEETRKISKEKLDQMMFY